MDAVATAATELILSSQRLPPLLNVVHPRPITWKGVFESINSSIGGQPLKMVPLIEWLETLESTARDGGSEDLQRLVSAGTVRRGVIPRLSPQFVSEQPALKIVPFLRAVAAAARNVGHKLVEAGGVPSYETSKLQHYCASMSSLEPLGGEHAEAWVAHWRRLGFLDA